MYIGGGELMPGNLASKVFWELVSDYVQGTFILSYFDVYLSHIKKEKVNEILF